MARLLEVPARPALAALQEWFNDGAHPARFPGAEVAHEVARVGRQNIGAELLQQLLLVRNLTRSSGTLPDAFAWSVLDWYEGRSSYASYIARPILRGAELLSSTRAVRTHLVADALLHELQGASSNLEGSDPGRRICRRLQMLRRFLEPNATAMPPETVRVFGHEPNATSYDSWWRISAAPLRELADRYAVDPASPSCCWLSASVLPTTTVWDEAVFVRIVQALELSFGLWADAVQELAIGTWQGAPQAEATLGSIADDILATRRLLMSLATILPVEFARIRATTVGASAIQSDGYAAFVRACEELADSLAIGAGGGTASIGSYDFTAAVDRVERAHLVWRRLHLHLAAQLIGDRPGTGGSTGVGYLSERVDTPLFTRRVD